MKKKVDISIIVPVYNVEKYLFDCLESIRSQSFENIEVIVINDGSTDKSGEIAKKFCNNDNRFKYISQENKGLGGARNTGILNSSGEYLFFLDSDDKLPNDAMEKLNFYKEKTKSDIIIGRTVWDKENFYNGTYLDNIFNKKEYFIKPEQLKDVVIVTAQLIKKQLIINNKIFFEEGVTSEDLEISLRLQSCSKKIYCVNDIVYLRTERDDDDNKSITQQFHNKIALDKIKSSKRIACIEVNEDYKFNKYIRIIGNLEYLRNGIVSRCTEDEAIDIINDIKSYIQSNGYCICIENYFKAVFLMNIDKFCILDSKIILKKLYNNNFFYKIKRKIYKHNILNKL